MSKAKRIIKKYPNRRLYDSESSSYITLEEVKQMILSGVDVQVFDAKTEEDLTRGVLLQILLESEASGSPMFSDELLTQLIRFYGQAMQGMIGGFIEQNIHLFLNLQKQIGEQNKDLYKDSPLLKNKLWNDFLGLQTPAMQNMISSYLAQNTQIYLDMQNKIQEQALQIFSATLSDKNK